MDWEKTAKEVLSKMDEDGLRQVDNHWFESNGFEINSVEDLDQLSSHIRIISGNSRQVKTTTTFGGKSPNLILDVS